MEMFLEVGKDEFGVAEAVTVRLLVLNNSSEPGVLDRTWLVGPNPVPERSVGAPFPVSVEPTLLSLGQNLITLNPWCLYGRQRTYDNFLPGRVTFYGYLLRQPCNSLLPEGPAEIGALLLSAGPVTVVIDGR